VTAAAAQTPQWTAEEQRVMDLTLALRNDPVLYVRTVFRATPDGWQEQALQRAPKAKRLGLSACKGPGKTTVLAWLGWWFMDTRRDAQGAALSVTRDNLDDNLWKEMAVWYDKVPHLQLNFEVQGETIVHRQRPDTWFLSARSFPQRPDQTQQANSLAGLHSEYVFILADEMGDYPVGVLHAANGIFQTRGQEAHLFAAWNCTSTSGAAYHAMTASLPGEWDIISITGDPDDPNCSPRVDKEENRNLITKYGPNDPLVRVNVLGLFPLTGAKRLASPDDFQLAQRRNAVRAAWFEEPIIWGLDVARFGTDRSKLVKRQGPILWRSHEFAHMDGVDLANAASYVIREDMKNKEVNPTGRQPDYIFVDVTGVGASPYDQLKRLAWGEVVVPIDFGARADDPQEYADKRAEMYWRGADWIKTVGCLPSNSQALSRDICEHDINWAKRGNRTCRVLEGKEEIRKRLGRSPDEGDAFALTFCVKDPVRRDRFLLSAIGAQAPSARCATEYERKD
jgi:phage terminase large subunit